MYMLSRVLISFIVLEVANTKIQFNCLQIKANMHVFKHRWYGLRNHKFKR